MQRLKDKRYTYRQIGDLFKISKQRVHQILTEYNNPYYQTEEYKKKRSESHAKWAKKNKIWKRIPYYKQGRSFWREKIRERDNHICQICGKIWQKGQRRFDVHKIDGDDNRKYEQGKDLSDWTTLCHKCHKNLPEHKKTTSIAMKRWWKKKK